MKMNVCYSFVLVTFVFFGCSKGPESYLAHFANGDNGLIQEKSDQYYSYELHYRTPEFLALIELSDDLNRKNYDDVLVEYGDLDYYLLKIKGTRGRKESELESLFSFSFKNRIKQRLDLEVLEPVMYHYENSSGVLGEHRILLAFKRFTDKDRIIIVDGLDQQSHRFIFSDSSIKKIPSLHL